MNNQPDRDGTQDGEHGLLAVTLTFFLRSLVRELSSEIDLRALGHGKNVIRRIAIYLVALLRDLFRIPTHDERGIAQARFRLRVSYISKTAIPTLVFFQQRYPLGARQRGLVEEAVQLLRRGESLLSDGRFPNLDAWYATMEEFHRLTEYSQAAARKLEEVLEVAETPVPFA